MNDKYENVLCTDRFFLLILFQIFRNNRLGLDETVVFMGMEKSKLLFLNIFFKLITEQNLFL